MLMLWKCTCRRCLSVFMCVQFGHCCASGGQLIWPTKWWLLAIDGRSNADRWRLVVIKVMVVENGKWKKAKAALVMIELCFVSVSQHCCCQRKWQTKLFLLFIHSFTALVHPNTQLALVCVYYWLCPHCRWSPCGRGSRWRWKPWTVCAVSAVMLCNVNGTSHCHWW